MNNTETGNISSGEPIDLTTYGYKTHRAEQLVRILNIDVDNMTIDELLAKFSSGVLFTANVDHLMTLQYDPSFRIAYANADYVSVDSQVVLWASHFLGTPIKQKISGSDFLPAYCDYHRNNPDVRIFLLGAATGVAEKAAEKINKRAGRKIIVGTFSPSMGFDTNDTECDAIVNMINNSDANVLVVGIGAPRQEIWINTYRRKFEKIKSFMALGATIDYEAGVLKRAPEWMSRSGVEWAYRLLQEPSRLWRRYLIKDVGFPLFILRQRWGLYVPPI